MSITIETIEHEELNKDLNMINLHVGEEVMKLCKKYGMKFTALMGALITNQMGAYVRFMSKKTGETELQILAALMTGCVLDLKGAKKDESTDTRSTESTKKETC